MSKKRGLCPQISGTSITTPTVPNRVQNMAGTRALHVCTHPKCVFGATGGSKLEYMPAKNAVLINVKYKMK